MTLNKMSIGGVFCRFDTGEFMSLLSNADGVFQLESETGEQSYISRAAAQDMLCIQVGDPDLLSQFNRNAALGRALYNADKTATRIMKSSSTLSEEYEGAVSVRQTVSMQIDHLKNRLDRTRCERSLGLNASRVFLYDLTQKGEGHKAVYLGHTISCAGQNTIMIDNRPYTKEQAQSMLAETKPKDMTLSLQSLLQNARTRLQIGEHKSTHFKDFDLTK